MVEAGDRDHDLATIRAHGRWAGLPDGFRRVLFLGMGSSRYAARVAALRLRARGIDAVAEYASADASYPAGPETLVVPISATGGSRETLDAVGRYVGGAPVVALVNTLDSPLAGVADRIVVPPGHPRTHPPGRSGASCRRRPRSRTRSRCPPCAAGEAGAGCP